MVPSAGCAVCAVPSDRGAITTSRGVAMSSTAAAVYKVNICPGLSLNIVSVSILIN